MPDHTQKNRGPAAHRAPIPGTQGAPSWPAGAAEAAAGHRCMKEPSQGGAPAWLSPARNADPQECGLNKWGDQVTKAPQTALPQRRQEATCPSNLVSCDSKHFHMMLIRNQDQRRHRLRKMEGMLPLRFAGTAFQPCALRSGLPASPEGSSVLSLTEALQEIRACRCPHYVLSQEEFHHQRLSHSFLIQFSL